MTQTRRSQPHGEWKPIPDPTELTTRQSALLREEMFRAMQCQREIFDARFAAADQATDRFRENLPRDLNLHIDTVKDLFAEKLSGHQVTTAEKFAGIEQQFKDRAERRRDELASSQAAIAAAFAANQKQTESNAHWSEKTIAKSEASTKESIDSLKDLLTGSINELRAQIGALTSRLDRGEGASKGLRDQSSDQRAHIGMVVGIASLCTVIVSMIVGTVVFVSTHTTTPVFAAASSPAGYSSPTVVSPAVVPMQPQSNQ